MTVGTVVAFVAYLSRLYGPASSLASVHVDITASVALFERIFQYLDMSPEIDDSPDAHPLPRVRGRVEFQDVSFHYREGHPVLEDVSFTMEPGQTFALVGPSGAGKTTLTYLLPRFYDPIAGRILIDGQDISRTTLVSPEKAGWCGDPGHLRIPRLHEPQPPLRTPGRHSGGD